MTKGGVALRKFPAPYEAMLAVCSDLDGCSLADFIDIHRFLNTCEETKWGQGLGLDIADSFWAFNDRRRHANHALKLDALDSDLSLYEGLGVEEPAEHQGAVAALLRTPWIDTLHSLGNLKVDNRGDAVVSGTELRVALSEIGGLLADICPRVRVWTDHGRVPFNLRIARPDAGDNSACGYYVGDVVRALGIEFLDIGDGTDKPGHDTLLTPYELTDGTSLWGFPRFAKTQDVGLIDAIPREHIEVLTERADGSKTAVLWHPPLLPYQLSEAVLDTLAARGQYLIVAQHLGWRAAEPAYDVSGPAGFTELSRQAFHRLKRYQHGGRVLVAGTARVLHYNRVQQHLVWRVHREARRKVIDISSVDDPVRGEFVPSSEDLRGICFDVVGDEAVELRVGGEPLLPELLRDELIEGERVVGVRWIEPDVSDYSIELDRRDAEAVTLLSHDRDYTRAVAERLRSAEPLLQGHRFDERQYEYAINYARERFTFRLEHYRRIFERIGFANRGRVLDAGCCVGDWSAALAALGNHVVGMDKNEAFLAVGRELLADQPFSERMTLQVGEVERLSFDDESFDSILCHGVLMFTEHDRALVEFARVLRPRGRLYVGYTDFGYRLSSMFADLLRGGFDQVRGKLRILLSRFSYDAGLADCGLGRTKILRREELIRLAALAGLRFLESPGVQDARGTQYGEGFTYDCVFEKPYDGNDDGFERGLHTATELTRAGAPLLAMASLADDPKPAGSQSNIDLRRARLKTCRPALVEGISAVGVYGRMAGDDSGASPHASELIDAMELHARRKYAEAARAYEKLLDTWGQIEGEPVEQLGAIALLQAGEYEAATVALDALVTNERDWQFSWLGRLLLAIETREPLDCYRTALQWAQALRERAQGAGHDLAQRQSGVLVQNLRRRVRELAPPEPTIVQGARSLLEYKDFPELTVARYSVLLGPINQAGQPATLVRTLRSRGVGARLYEFRAHRFGYGSDLVVNPDAMRRNRSTALFESLAYLLREGFDLFHLWHTGLLHFSLHRGLTGMDLPLLKASGGALLFRFTGWDARLTDVEQRWNPYSAFKYGYELTGYMSDDDKRRWLDHVRCHADCLIVQDPELRRYVPEAVIVPRAIDLETWPAVDTSSSARPVIVHAPTDSGSKGSHLFEHALDNLAQQGLSFDYRPLKGLSHGQMRAEMEAADIVLDQLHIGWYGVTTVEAMALGKVSVVYIHPAAADEFGEELPVALADPENVEQVMAQLIKNPELRAEIGGRARVFAERHHCARKIAEQLDSLYQRHLPAETAPRRETAAANAVHWLATRNVSAVSASPPADAEPVHPAQPARAPAKPVDQRILSATSAKKELEVGARTMPKPRERMVVRVTNRLRQHLPGPVYWLVRACWRAARRRRLFGPRP